MHDSSSERNAADDGADELASLGFDDDAGDRWLECLRRASWDVPLGHIGPYEILHEIGRGGQGVVYRARQPGTGRDIAVKRLISGSFASVEARQRFEREIRATAALDHPHIVTVFAREIIDGQPVLAMQWIDGVPITEWTAPTNTESSAGAATLHRGAGRRALPEMLGALLKVTQAVHYAHQRGLIHRDLKPSNILVDARGEPHLLDFGLAKIIDAPEDDAAALTQAEGVVGTPSYAAPEQLEGAADGIDIRADVYALGVVLYRMLTGELPHAPSRSAAQALAAIRAAGPAPPSRRVAECDRELDAIVLKALAVDPGERYQSMDAFAADLRRYLAGEPVAAHPPGVAYQLRKFITRHRGPAVLAGAAVLSLIAFAVVAAGLARSAEQARREERAARLVTEEVNSFLGQILAGARPSRGGANVTLLQMLDEAGARAMAELDSQPPVAAEVLYQIGFTYRTLWRYEEALPHLKKALEIERQLHAGDHENVARCLAALGAVQTSLRKPEAVDLQREALEMRRRLYGDEHALVAESMMRLGYALHQAAAAPQWDEAEAAIAGGLAVYRRVLGPDHRDVGSCLHNYGWLRVRQGRIAEAAALYAEALDVFHRAGNLQDPFYAECMYGYVAQLLKLQRHAEAAVWLDEAIPLIRRIYGENDALRSLLWQRAEAQQALGEFTAARRSYIEAFTALLARQADSVPQAAASLRRLSLMLALASDAQPPEIPAGEIAGSLAGLPPDEHGRLAAGLHRYAGLLAAEGREEEACALIQTLRDLRAAHGAPGDAALAGSLELLAERAGREERFDDAVLLHEEALELLKGAPLWEQARVHSALGACLLELGRAAEAEAMLLQSQAVLSRSLGPDHPLTRAVTSRLHKG